MRDLNDPDQDRRASKPRTLGDVLSSGTGNRRVSEAEWVELVGSIATGDQSALHALYHQTYPIVFTLILRITKNRETAEELTVDVFHDVWKNASRYDPAGGSVVGWILNQARSRAIDRLRFEQRKKRVNTYGETPVTATHEVDPQEAYEFEQMSLTLRSAVADLAPEERQVIETAFFSEMTL
jgi:RNA polymerase sigma-70 factor (ECF subfamily)